MEGLFGRQQYHEAHLFQISIYLDSVVSMVFPGYLKRFAPLFNDPYLALAHGPTGCFKVKDCTSTKPAFSSLILSCFSLGITRPALFMASSMARPHRTRALSGVKVPSSLRHSTDTYGVSSAMEKEHKFVATYSRTP
jgi:hypothetical protein